MKDIKFIVAVILLVSTGAYAEPVFLLHVSISKNGSVETKDFQLVEGKVNLDPASSGEYAIKMVSSGGKGLFTDKLPVGFTAYAETRGSDGKLQAQKVELEKRGVVFRLPYTPEAENIELYHNDTLLYALSIPEKLCVKDGNCIQYCQERNDPDCTPTFKTPKDETSPPERDSNGTWPYILYILAATAIIFALLAAGKRTHKK